ncbi:16S rRNA (adenine(1518)-N(6)/adenine(1519)-N(6))-dimethyltransferase RsmA [Sulfurospirillum diekertiae]|uniref:16S rRNA (adenine(1518)-N(6)/adenine(1519)-N(6))- dimethyltransferase RsmA n=1 Tax=Sulfurospirillum diekertiae TaxID=1854492 RepID=UPI000DC6E5BA|nr:16S rRNA (adenine(1518)-N(6)/adenine(1519)-N(6))-dimethyltransferase RsmA [Sulfurospirillum diekertiae]ASC92132.1 Ribosomal RNA small subunit methyltransferase A [Sulfurospirillum diekertiae]
MIEAKKKFGQNFLQDTTVVSKIIQSMPRNERKLVEIGPGLGDLTQELLKVKALVAYEVDEDLCVYLRKKYSTKIDEGELTLVQTDVLKQFEKGSLCEEPYDLVANLPYYIATTIILEALEDPNCKSMTVMIQKEVAEKFAALPKTKEFTSLAILAQSIGTAAILFDVSPESFEPQPKVVSSILKIDKQKEFVEGKFSGLFESNEQLQKFKKYLRCSFQSPRKTWLKNISSEFDKAYVEKNYVRPIPSHNNSSSRN